MRTLPALLFFIASTSFAGLSPPQGKSLRSDGDYGISEQPLSWWDIEGRLDRRRKLQDTEAPKSDQKASDVRKVRAQTSSSKSKTSIAITQSSAIAKTSNLPDYYQDIDRSQMKASDRVVFVPQNGNVKLNGVHVGDTFYATIEQRIKASPSVPTPIRAMITSGSLKGGFFIGEATLDRELKRILLAFTKVRGSDGKAYSVRATGLASDGSVGLDGEYHSQAGAFFVAELASATAAGFLDSTINRSQNAVGNYVQEPSLQNSAKAGAVTALSRSADRMAEQVRQAPEYTEIAGFQSIRVIVQDDPTELN